MSFEYVDVISMTIPKGFTLLPGITDIHEINMALTEIKTLTDPIELQSRSAYFSYIHGNPTNLFLIGVGGYLDVGQKNSKRQNFFKEFSFKTGYASHGLFPYRGKFHPQLVRGLLNILDVPAGGMVLDPMGGSGTTAVEANLLGIDAITGDLNPFCTFMMSVKTDVLRISDSQLNKFRLLGNKLSQIKNQSFHSLKELDQTISTEKLVKELFQLAYIDTIGYKKRRKTGSFGQLLSSVTKRYYDTLHRFVKVRDQLKLKMGKSKIYNKSIQDIDFKHLVDAIITSPPYSFAIDYVANDAENLKFMGENPTNLYDGMIGLRGKKKSQRIENYFNDMNVGIERIYHALKPNGKVCLIVGDNTKQTGGIKLSEKLKDQFENNNFKKLEVISRQIKGIRNTMKKEYMLIYQKR